MWRLIQKLWRFWKEADSVIALFATVATGSGAVMTVFSLFSGFTPAEWFLFTLIAVLFALAITGLSIVIHDWFRRKHFGPGKPVEVLFGPYQSARSVANNGTLRGCSIVIRNNTKRYLTNVSLLLKDVDGRHAQGVEYFFLPRDFQLAPRTTKQFEVATHKCNGTPQKIELCCDISAISGGFGPTRYELEEGEHILSLEVSSREQKTLKFQCRVFIAENGRLDLKEH